MNISCIKILTGISTIFLLISCAKDSRELKAAPPEVKRPLDAAINTIPVTPLPYISTKTQTTNSLKQDHSYASRPEVMRMAIDIAQRNQLDPQWVQGSIGQAHYLPSVAQATMRATQNISKNWSQYRRQFVNPAHIKAGVQFWKKYRATLNRAQVKTGVPVPIIVGVLGVETTYGQHMGQYRVIDALCTLAFDFPAEHPKASERTALFLRELEAFLKLSRDAGVSPSHARGSYAGAMGLPQFLPSSWSRYAVDFDGDGRIDLFHSPADAIGSVANYLKAFQWKPGVQTHYPLQIKSRSADLPDLLAPGIVPTFSSSALAAKGGMLNNAGLRYPGLLALVELQNGTDEPLYIAGTENFYAITRYNWSSYYALAVIELGQAVAAAMP